MPLHGTNQTKSSPLLPSIQTWLRCHPKFHRDFKISLKLWVRMISAWGSRGLFSWLSSMATTLGTTSFTCESLAILYTTCRQIKGWKWSLLRSWRPWPIVLFSMLGSCIMIIISGRVGSQGFYPAYFLTWSPVRANKGCIPTPSNHASCPSFDTMADMINDTLTVASQSHSTAKKNVGRVFSFQEFLQNRACVIFPSHNITISITNKGLMGTNE